MVPFYWGLNVYVGLIMILIRLSIVYLIYLGEGLRENTKVGQ